MSTGPDASMVGSMEYGTNFPPHDVYYWDKDFHCVGRGLLGSRQQQRMRLTTYRISANFCRQQSIQIGLLKGFGSGFQFLKEKKYNYTFSAGIQDYHIDRL